MILKLILGIPAAFLAGLVVYRAIAEREVGPLASLLSMAIAFVAFQPLRREVTLGNVAIALVGCMVAALTQELALRRRRDDMKRREDEGSLDLSDSARLELLEQRRIARRVRRPS